MTEYTKAELDELNTLLESHLFGTKTLKDMYFFMTPGQPGYMGMNHQNDIIVSSRDGEADPKDISETEDLDTKKDTTDGPGGLGENKKSFFALKNRLSKTHKYKEQNEEDDLEAPPVTGFAKQTKD